MKVAFGNAPHYRKCFQVSTASWLRWVEGVLVQLGIIGDLESPGGGNKALVGPLWVSAGRERHPKLVADYKTAWVADLQDLPKSFHTTRRSRNERQAVEALEQLYGYMTFDNNRYGTLSN